jgi:Domain of unknown function (DUF4184)
MPYTISHVMAVLPFSRLLARWRLLSACVIGAMVPDFGLFLPWRPERAETHSVIALLTFCLPVGLFTYWIFQFLIKTPVLEVLPEGAYARSRPLAAPADFRSLRSWALAACGVLAGAITHLVWDAFTHEGARGVRMFPALDDPLVEIGRRHWDAVRVLQDLGSLVGLAVVVVLLVFALRPGHGPPILKRPLIAMERRWWVLTYVLSAIACGIAFYLHLVWGQPQTHSPLRYAYDVAIAALRGLVAALLLVSLALGARLRALRQRSSGPGR